MTVDETGGELPELPVEVPSAGNDAPVAESAGELTDGPTRSEYADRVGGEIESDDADPAEPAGTDVSGAEAVAAGERQLHAANQADELATRAGEGDDLGGPVPTTEDLYAFGGSKDDGFPRPPRPKDFGVESADETVGPYEPTAPTDQVPGASTYTSVEAGQAEGLTGQVFRLPESSDLPSGLRVHEDAGDEAPEGHRTVYPAEEMPLSEFQSRWSYDLSWDWHGTVSKRGVFRPAQDDQPG